MKPDEVKRMEEEEDEEFVGLNVDTNLLEVVQVLLRLNLRLKFFMMAFWIGFRMINVCERILMIGNV